MQVMTARDAKNHFGELMDTAQREPVLITKNNRPMNVLLAFEDLRGTYLEDLFLEKEDGHDEWVKNKVTASIRRLEAEGSKGRTSDEVHNSVMDKVRQRLANKK